MRDSKEKDRNKYAGEKKRDNANKKLKTIEEYHKNREKWNFCTNKSREDQQKATTSKKIGTVEENLKRWVIAVWWSLKYQYPGRTSGGFGDSSQTVRECVLWYFSPRDESFCTFPRTCRWLWKLGTNFDCASTKYLAWNVLGPV
jgi:hypothetical protein